VRRWQRVLPRLSPGAGARLVERWRALGGREPVPLGAEKDDLGRAPRARPAVPEGCTVDSRRFAEVEAAFLVDAGQADRRARELVDGDLSSACAGHALADLFLRAGDPTRALAWAEEVAAEDPTDALAHQQAATALARQGNLPRAQLALQQAEFWSERRGEPSRILARELLAADRPIEALGAGRQALALAPAGERWSIFEVLVEAARAAGREEDARTLLAAARAELPEGARERAAAPPERESPWAVAAKERRARDERPGTAARLGIEAELLLQGLIAEGPLARAALEAFARLAEAGGQGELAADARSEARRLPGGVPGP
jgi:hypothetical protein